MSGGCTRAKSPIMPPYLTLPSRFPAGISSKRTRISSHQSGVKIYLGIVAISVAPPKNKKVPLQQKKNREKKATRTNEMVAHNLQRARFCGCSANGGITSVEGSEGNTGALVQRVDSSRYGVASMLLCCPGTLTMLGALMHIQAPVRRTRTFLTA